MLTLTINLMTLFISILVNKINIIACITSCPCLITILLVTHTIIYYDQSFYHLSTVPNNHHK